MRIVRHQISAPETLIRELLTIPRAPAAMIVVGESDAHRQAVIDFLYSGLTEGFGQRCGRVRCYSDSDLDQFNCIFSYDSLYRFVDVDAVHSGQLKARSAIIRRLLSQGAKTVVMLWVDFNPGDPPLDWSNTPVHTDDTRTFRFDPSVPKCRPIANEADIFYHLCP